MGFCPHRRCQLSSLHNSPKPGVCPQGLCYTKLEDGAPTYGACCFDEDGEGGREGWREGASLSLITPISPTSLPLSFPSGLFSSGDILGYVDLLRQTPKPIYKRNRVVLGEDPLDESKVRKEGGREGRRALRPSTVSPFF